MLPLRMVQHLNRCLEGMTGLHPWILSKVSWIKPQVTLFSFGVHQAVVCKQNLSVLTLCPLLLQAGAGDWGAPAPVCPGHCLREMLLPVPSGRGRVGPSALRGHRHCV